MALNPPPLDISHAQFVVDASSGNLRARADDERTASGAAAPQRNARQRGVSRHAS